MVFKNFRLNCIIRILLLAVFIFIFIYFIMNTNLFAVYFIFGAAIIYQIFSLIHYIEKTNRDLYRFLEAIKYDDFSQSFSAKNLGTSFTELKQAFNEVLLKFQKTRAEREEHHRYLETVVQHIGIGLISFKLDGEIGLINTAAKRLLKSPQLKNIKSLNKLSQELVRTLFKLEPGEKALVKFTDENETLQFAIYATGFILREQRYKLVSLQNIQTELEEKEMEAWQNLIRVLTHEIMNSITPISSLASTVNGLLSDCQKDKDQCKQIDSEILEDVSCAVQTIEKRSNGLLNFVQSYRKLYRIPSPNFQIFQVSSLFERITQLMSAQMKKNNIIFKTTIDPETLELTADPEMIEQVLINLLLNSIIALKNQTSREVVLSAKLDLRSRTTIQVFDNGSGIEKDVLSKIFIPFFTTKQDGSGIGLSLSRQIMRLHKGSISVASNPGVETIFTLRF